jgi:hypothetical protein
VNLIANNTWTACKRCVKKPSISKAGGRGTCLIWTCMWFNLDGPRVHFTSTHMDKRGEDDVPVELSRWQTASHVCPFESDVHKGPTRGETTSKRNPFGKPMDLRPTRFNRKFATVWLQRPSYFCYIFSSLTDLNITYNRANPVSRRNSNDFVHERMVTYPL